MDLLLSIISIYRFILYNACWVLVDACRLCLALTKNAISCRYHLLYKNFSVYILKERDAMKSNLHIAIHGNKMTKTSYHDEGMKNRMIEFNEFDGINDRAQRVNNATCN